MRDSFVPIAYRSHRSVLSSGLNGGLSLLHFGCFWVGSNVFSVCACICIVMKSIPNFNSNEQVS